MFQESDMLFLYVETPLHAGTGSGLGAVDLPIQRERVTGYPLVQASSVKGVLRSVAEGAAQGNGHQRKVVAVFGPKTNKAHEHAGAFSPGDARLLLFPVRSLLGIFAWTTSRHALSRFLRDAKFARLPDIDWSVPRLPTFEDENGEQYEKALVCTDNDISADNQVVLEEFAFEVETSEKLDEIAAWLAKYALPGKLDERGERLSDEYDYWADKLPRRLIILPKDDFREFTRFSTEVVARIQLDQKTKTVAGPALWTEENLPTDTLLYVPVYATRPRSKQVPEGWQGAKDVLNFVRTTVTGRVQIGGNETIGRGIVALRWVERGHGQEGNDG